MPTVEDGGFGLVVISVRRFHAGGGRNATTVAAAVAKEPVRARSASMPDSTTQGERNLGHFFGRAFARFRGPRTHSGYIKEIKEEYRRVEAA